MPSSKSHSRGAGAHSRGSHHGGGGGDSHGGGGGGGGGNKLVKVAFARNQAEAEMLQGLLTEAEVPSVLKRSRGFDNPDFLSAGPHDVLVHSDLAQKARDVLAETLVDSEGEERAELLDQARLEHGGGQTSTARFALWFAVAVIAAAAIVWILYQLS